MVETVIPEALLSLLRSVDTPTVCNAIEVAQGQRGFSGYTTGTMQHSRPGAPAMVGYARTAKIAGRTPSTEAPEVLRERRLDYFRSMAAGPRPAVAVVEDTDGPDCIAGWWGEVHSAVHKGLGLSGAVTNGVMRDLDVMEPGFPVLAGSIGVSHGHVHVSDIACPVSILGLKVHQGDLIHADRHGAIVIPDELIGVLAQSIDTVVSLEAIVLEPAREAGFTIQKLEEAWRQFEKKRT